MKNDWTKAWKKWAAKAAKCGLGSQPNPEEIRKAVEAAQNIRDSWVVTRDQLECFLSEVEELISALPQRPVIWKKPTGIFFCDELPQAKQDLQKAMLGLPMWNLHSTPGTGKSSIVARAAKKRGVKVKKVKKARTIRATDIRGLPKGGLHGSREARPGKRRGV